jgi:hypothetical protein
MGAGVILGVLLAVIGVPGLARADSSSSSLAVFSRSYVTNHFYSAWSGSAWGTVTQYSTGPDESIWMATANCPTRNHIAIATLDYSQDVRVVVCSGGAFGSSQVATTGTGGYGQRRFDIGYEQTSGDLLVAYWDNATLKVGYRTSSGTTLSAQSTLTLPSTAAVEFLTLAPKAGGNDIAMVCANSSATLYGSIWTGAGWFSVGALTSSLAAATKECFAVAWENVSGDVIVVYGVSGSSTAKYLTFSGGALSSELSLPAVSGVPQWVRLASKPGSNTIVCGIVDANRSLYAFVWNGSSWSAAQLINSNTGSIAERRFDVCFEPGGSNALIAYSSNTGTLKYRTWNGSSWSAEQSGAGFGGVVQIVQLKPAATGGTILGLCSDADWQLNAFAWNGSSMVGSTLINDPLGGESNCEAFSLVGGGSVSQKRIISWSQVAPP